jgi:chromatin remodeling complex protein RSC6
MTTEKKPSALAKPVKLSQALEEVIGKGPMPRSEVTKKIWAYIKKNELQDNKDRRSINPDAKLAKVLGSQQINMFKMTAEVSKHLTA